VSHVVAALLDVHIFEKATEMIVAQLVAMVIPLQGVDVIQSTILSNHQVDGVLWDTNDWWEFIRCIGRIDRCIGVGGPNEQLTSTHFLTILGFLDHNTQSESESESESENPAAFATSI